MSKDFQIRDGNLIASFDLENEDGDIDFCKLFKVSKGVAYEIGMFVDYVATNKIIKDQSKQISDLEAKLAESNESHHKNIVELTKMATEKDRKIEELKQQLAEKDKEITQRLVIQERDYNQDKISFALEQLKLARRRIDCLRYNENNCLNKKDCIEDCLEEIDNQIKQLKEKK